MRRRGGRRWHVPPAHPHRRLPAAPTAEGGCIGNGDVTLVTAGILVKDGQVLLGLTRTLRLPQNPLAYDPPPPLFGVNWTSAAADRLAAALRGVDVTAALRLARDVDGRRSDNGPAVSPYQTPTHDRSRTCNQDGGTNRPSEGCQSK